MFLLNISRLFIRTVKPVRGGCEQILANPSVSFSCWTAQLSKNQRPIFDQKNAETKPGIFRVYSAKRRETSGIIAPFLLRPRRNIHSESRTGIEGGENCSQSPGLLSKREQRTADVGLLLSAPESLDVLARTRIITDPTQCREVVAHLLELGEPIGLDMEGLRQGDDEPDTGTGLLQVCDINSNIYLFRTGLCSRLLTEGRLKDLLEDPRILKIMHGSSVDCISIYRDGVKFSRLYDTAVAHKVRELQRNGRSLHTANSISLNDLCSYCGLHSNPFKDMFRNHMWKDIVNGNILRSADPLPLELVLYCAWDVEPLLSIHQFLRTNTDPDFQQLVTTFSDLEIVRAIDRGLAKRKRLDWRRMENCSLYLRNLDPSVVKPQLYSIFSLLNGTMDILFSCSDRSCLVIFKERLDALEAFSPLENQLISELGPNLEVKLMVGEVHAEPERLIEKTVKQNWRITNPQVLKNLVNLIISSGVPVLLNFRVFSQGTTCDLYLGAGPSVQVDVTAEMIEEGGMGSLFSSQKVEKVVYRLNDIPVLKVVSGRSYKVCNIFNISAAYKFVEFSEFGGSVFKGDVPGIRTMLRNLGMEIDISGKESRLDWHYTAYLALQQSLPSQVVERFSDLNRVNIDLVIGDPVKAKLERKKLRRRFEDLTIHFRTGDPTNKLSQNTLKSEIIKFTNQHGFDYKYDELERSSLLELSNLNDAKTSLQYFKTVDISGFGVSVTLPNNEDGEQTLVTELNRHRTELGRTRNLANLRSSGVLDYLENLNSEQVQALP